MSHAVPLAPHHWRIHMVNDIAGTDTPLTLLFPTQEAAERGARALRADPLMETLLKLGKGHLEVRTA